MPGSGKYGWRNFAMRHALLAFACLFALANLINAIRIYQPEWLGFSKPPEKIQIAVMLPVLPEGALKGRSDHDAQLRIGANDHLQLALDPSLPVPDLDPDASVKFLKTPSEELLNWYLDTESKTDTSADAVPIIHGNRLTSAQPSATKIAGLYEVKAGKIIPRRSADGRSAVTAFAAKSDARPGFATASVILTDIAGDEDLMRELLPAIPRSVGLSIAANEASENPNYSAHLRRFGHELLLQLVAQENQKNGKDHYKNQLLALGSHSENRKKLTHQLASLQGYCAALLLNGEALARREESLGVIMKELNQRGLGIVYDQEMRHNRISQISAEQGYNVAAGRQRKNLPPAKMVARLSGQKGHSVFFLPASAELLQLLPTWLDKLRSEGVTLTPICAQLGAQQS